MSQRLDLKQIERKAWTSTFQDGLYDLWLGWLILWLGVIYVLSQLNLPWLVETSVNMGVYLLSLVALRLSKRHITTPRIGHVHWGPRRRARVRWVGVILFILVGVTFALPLLGIPALKDLYPLFGPFALGLFFLLFFGLAAFFLDYPRLYVIGLMFALPEPLMALCRLLWNFNPGFWAFLTPALVVIGMGLVIFRRFLQEYPVPDISESGVSHDQNQPE